MFYGYTWGQKASGLASVLKALATGKKPKAASSAGGKKGGKKSD